MKTSMCFRKAIQYITLFILCLLLLQPAFSQIRYSTIKIFIPKNEVKLLRLQGIEFDHGEYNDAEQSFTNSFSSHDFEKIKALKYRYEVLVYDEMFEFLHNNQGGDFYELEHEPVRGMAGFEFQPGCQSYEAYITTPQAFTSGSRAGFYTLPELEAIYDQMVLDYPALVRKIAVGTSVQGRTIWAIKISDLPGNDEDEPELLYTGLHHSREGMSMMNLIYYMQYLLENYNKDKKIEELVNNRELFFVPCVNVDGYNYNTTATNWNAGRRMRRKNMRATGGTQNADGSGGAGVDLNRNFAKYWNFNNTGSSGTASSDSYRGPSAFSEPETQAMRAFINSREFTMAINYHCYGNWWIRPNGPASSTTLLGASDVAAYKGLADMLTKYNGYVYGTASETVYEVNGYSDDWLFSDDLGLRSKVFAFSPEIGTVAEGGFWATIGNIIPLAKKQLFANLQVAYAGGSYADITDKSDISITSLNGSFNYTVTRRGLTDAPIKVTLVPLQNMLSAGPANTITSIANYLGEESGSVTFVLPNGLPAGAFVKYVWELETGGITFRDTVTKLYNPQVVFSDDMESPAIVTTLYTLGSGSLWNYSAAEAANGARSLTESPSGNYTSNANHTIKLKNAINLSGATTAYLSYLIKYNAQNHQDRLMIELSTGGVNGTYTAICGANTIRETSLAMNGTPAYTGGSNGWIREIIDLSAYAGNTNLGIQFRFMSNASVVADGFKIDDIKVVKSNASILPVEFSNISARYLRDGALIEWTAEIEDDFSIYEIQRSRNGLDFVTIGKSGHSAKNAFFDDNPFPGSNLYRIKAINIDGGFKYSKIVSVFVKSTITVGIYPNPFSNQLNIDVNRVEPGTVIIELSNMLGQVAHSEQVNLPAGHNTVRIDTKKLPSQLYTVTVKDLKTQNINTGKVLKQ